MSALLYSEVEEDLRASVRALLAAHCAPEALLGRVEQPDLHDAKVWHGLGSELGVAGLAVPEHLGGAGAGWRETAVVLEELGRSLAPVPYLGSSVIATAVLLAAGETQLLPEVAAGRRIAALALPFATWPDAPLPDRLSIDGGTLTGRVQGVADARHADLLLVYAGGALHAVEAARVLRTPVTSLDLTRPLCDLDFAGTPYTTLAFGPDAERAVRAGLTAGAALLPSEMLGVAEWCLTAIVGYAKERYQFGRQIGSFQAVKHRLADLWIGVTQARAVARNAASALADGSPGVAAETALAKAFVSGVVVRTAEESLHLHGAIGFTWEHPMHLFLKRAKSTSLALGTADRHRAALAGLVNLPA
ncbi:acyl-CoA dehydrogenase family protein [Catellatospora sp. NPDC049609]|uniref:acyl-CoA dehydrogenase family protein n=1 Tax=Catellatospora sp. NPDC049609 TaxID=3155505 RepID=UPI0034391A37